LSSYLQFQTQTEREPAFPSSATGATPIFLVQPAAAGLIAGDRGCLNPTVVASGTKKTLNPYIYCLWHG
jgi:hypothetical protein